MITAVLFDADGVIQRAKPFDVRLTATFGIAPDDVSGLAQDIFIAEQPAIRDEAHFPDLLAPAFARRGLVFDEERFFTGWHQFDVNLEVLDIVALLRAKGLHCALASNQEPIRADHMSRVLGYRDRFDAEYYSSHLGHAKPSTDYFHAVMRASGLDRASPLFIDDRTDNVESARHAGLHAAQFDLPETGAGETLWALLRDFGIEC